MFSLNKLKLWCLYCTAALMLRSASPTCRRIKVGVSDPLWGCFTPHVELHQGLRENKAGCCRTVRSITQLRHREAIWLRKGWHYFADSITCSFTTAHHCVAVTVLMLRRIKRVCTRGEGGFRSAGVRNPGLIKRELQLFNRTHHGIPSSRI